MQLAIDTSTDVAGLAITQGGKVLAELSWYCRRNHSNELLPRLASLLKQSKLDIGSADGIIVAQGPGSYNGLRVGISTAKALAFSLGIPVVGISTLEAEAYQYAAIGLPICPVFSAGRDKIATALYQGAGNEWRQLAVEHLTTLDELCRAIDTRTIFCGEFLPLVVEGLKERLGEKAAIPPTGEILPRIRFLAELGIRRLKAGDYDDVATLQPLYLRQPHITQPRGK
ncbi:MAG: tRNA (adenosine(37)-N6)-threonylcarbamoyltransferase complex dimerization subunit type 1 TsaB [Chloroflexota bacterium]